MASSHYKKLTCSRVCSDCGSGDRVQLLRDFDQVGLVALDVRRPGAAHVAGMKNLKSKMFGSHQDTIGGIDNFCRISAKKSYLHLLILYTDPGEK